MKLPAEEILLDLISDLDKRPDFAVEDIRKKVAFIATPRSGSTLFCRILEETGKVGNPREWINMNFMDVYLKYFNLSKIDMKQYLNFIARKTVSPNGIFSIKIHVDQHEAMTKHNLDLFSINFDKCYYLYRKEKISQAYSLAKAQLTNQWTSEHKAQDTKEGKIDNTKIIKALLHISRCEDFYSNHLKKYTDREYCYEDFSSFNTTNAFTEILQDLEIGDAELSFATSLKKQRSHDDLSEIARLKEYLLPAQV